MTLINLSEAGRYKNHYNFIENWANWNEFKNLFAEEDIKEIVDSKVKDEDKIVVLCEHLNSLGWSDGDIINKFLERDKKKWWLNYDGEIDTFILYEVLE